MSQSIQIRLATTTDLPAIQTCVQLAFAKYLTRMLVPPEPLQKDYQVVLKTATLFVITVAHQCAGLLELHVQPHDLVLKTIAVHPDYQGQALGKRLLQFAESFGKQHHKSEIHLYTNEKMTENIALYQHFGYRIYATGIENGFHRVYFKKVLS